MKKDTITFAPSSTFDVLTMPGGSHLINAHDIVVQLFPDYSHDALGLLEHIERNEVVVEFDEGTHDSYAPLTSLDSMDGVTLYVTELAFYKLVLISKALGSKELQMMLADYLLGTDVLTDHMD